ncbi:MAG: polar amino acid transport system permease protein [Actinomycetota bacterium]|jgi:polar amino acid transport system permease protein|nr:polar amino acid transport system permease protein [Actinomycetota bacterium]
MAYTFRFDAVYNNLPFLLEGIYLTLFISGVSLVLSMALGLIVAVGRLSSSRALSLLSATYLEVFRDTPVLVQLFWVYYVLPILLGIRIDALTASILGLTLHSAAFLSEIYRAGIQTVPVGHIEAAKVLGLSRLDTFLRIVMPQAVRNVLPPLVNNLIDLIKLSSLSSVFAVGEITRKAGELSASTFRPLEIFSFVAILYFMICWPLSLLIRGLERRLRFG